jgi:exopolyphosphatase/pppGpp-phosphohydrolase
MKNITKLDLSKYEKIYDSFDSGHNRNHFIAVRKLAVSLAKKYSPKKIELAYIAATLHDIGLSLGRENHELNGEKIIRQDTYLSSNLTKNELNEICHAVKEHRATSGKPKTILAKIISDADRTGGYNNPSKVFSRSYFYGLKKEPNLTKKEQILRTTKFLTKKYSKNSYGRRAYFSETKKRIAKSHDPIISAYKKQDFKYLKSLIKSLVK